MEAQDNSKKNPKTPSKGTWFFIAVLIGLLLGALVTLLVIDITGYHHPTVVNMIRPEDVGPSNSDTVVKYVIHKYESPARVAFDRQDLDTLASDSLTVMDETEDLTMDYEELYMAGDQEEQDAVAADRMLAKSNVKILYLDANKQLVATPEQKPATLQVQQWTTPIRNKITYQLSGNILKIKGLNPDNIKIYSYKNGYLLQSGGRVYSIHPNTQFERLAESSDMAPLP
ncbi:MAG: hypothetical protein IKQ20_12020 [Bacteroidales bacterium]|nr:hypothetical protein [Bacteroidales bacterium]